MTRRQLFTATLVATAALVATATLVAAGLTPLSASAQASPAPGSATPSPRTVVLQPPPSPRTVVIQPPPSPRSLVIQPLGRTLSKPDVAEVVAALKTFYGLEVSVLPRRKLPRAAYYRPRRRYRAEKLLDHLGRIGPKNAYRILGLTAVDISTTKGQYRDWGIMGLANLSGRLCVISRFRCARASRNRIHARHRLAKVAVHEIGHTLGLDHCPNRGCLLESGKGSNKTTDREYVLCARCRRKLRQLGFRLPPNPRPPWPKP
ncbi:MAG: matrixin family metalloprotease [bacterium]